jgi:Zn finger protein HypA/HybF involved in hydrogenase expression
MHHYAHAIFAVLLLAVFIGVILKLHLADVASTAPKEVAPCHKTCAYVNLLTGEVRTVEPGFVEFCIEGLLNKVTTNGAKSRLHLQPEPV